MIKQTIHGVKKVTIGDVVETGENHWRHIFVYTKDTEFVLTLFGDVDDLEMAKAADDLIPMDTIDAPTEELRREVKFPAKYDQDMAVKKTHDRAWRAIEGCTQEEYYDKVKADIDRKQAD